MASTPTQIAAQRLSADLDCDVFLFSGEIDRASAVRFEKLLASREARPGALLVLVTPGGDPDAAYRIARAFQRYYPGRTAAFIPGWCKSAGTLITLAACKLYIGDLGELGPLDVQLAKQDEIGEAASGLLIETTLRTLESTAARMFVNMTRSIRVETGVTTKLAAELSAKMVIGLMTPMFAQIEPLRVGENARAMNITMHYGRRLANVSKCLQDVAALEYMIRAYPDHGFVIDRKEARLLYKNVEKPTALMKSLLTTLGSLAAGESAGEPTRVECLSTDKKPTISKSHPNKGRPDVQRSKARRSSSGGGARIAGPTRKGASRRPDRANGATNQI